MSYTRANKTYQGKPCQGKLSRLCGALHCCFCLFLCFFFNSLILQNFYQDVIYNLIIVNFLKYSYNYMIVYDNVLSIKFVRSSLL